MASKIAEKKVEEANASMKEADKLITKTLFRWKPDWESAVPLYERAGTCYKNAKVYDKAKVAFKKASEGHNILRITFSAAKYLEEAGMMAREEKCIAEAADLFQQASMLYRENGSSDKAAETLVKAARAIEEEDPEKAILLYKDAILIYETDDKLQYAGQTFRYAVALSVQQRRLEDAIDILKQQESANAKLNHTSDLFKTQLSMVIIYLHQGDYVAADKLFQDASLTEGFVNSPEGRAIVELLDAYERNSPEQLKLALGKQVFGFLDNQVSKLAKQLKIVEEGVASPEDEGGLA